MTEASYNQIVRIKIGEGKGFIDFRASEKFIVYNKQGDRIIDKCNPLNSWRIKIEKNDQFNADDCKNNTLFEIFDAEYRQSAKIEGELVIEPINESATFTLFDMVLGEGFHWEHRVKKQFSGRIKFIINDKGNIDAIVSLPLETYLQGVVPAEMGYHYPIEALKAQAVVSRTWTLKHLQGHHSESHYDVCSDRHCQLFHTHSTSELAPVKAVEQTKGQVVKCKNLLVNTYFHTLCGGHTEISQCDEDKNKMSSPGVYDSFEKPEKFIDLSKDEIINEWIKKSPQVFCNITEVMGHQKLAVAKRYFRWEVTYTRRELEEIIKDKLDKDIGILYGILITERGQSGRIKEIELLCSHDNFRIQGELNIRQLLSEKALNSSCFTMHTEMDQDGIPISFTFTGAGSGHGMGMCQTGAAAMAMGKLKYKDIIAHYFPNTKIVRLDNR